jgi:MFS family permease
MKNVSNNLKNLFWTQFLGALNDNIFKNALIIMITYQGVSLFNLNSKMLVAMAGGIFILPFLLLSAISGELSNKVNRILIVRWVKIIEIIIMILASIGIFIQNYYLLFFVLFLLGIHSTFFGPIKYSLIPEYSKEEELVFSNALISAGTFISILLGTIIGGFLAEGIKFAWALKFILVIVSLAGLYFARKLPDLPAEKGNLTINWNILKSTRTVIKMMLSDKEVYTLLFGLSWFWFLGAGILSLVPSVAKDIFKAKEAVATTMLFVFTLGMGLGPFVLEKITKGKIIRPLIPISLFLMSLFMFDVVFVLKQFLGGNYLPQIFESISLSQFLDLRFAIRFLFDLFCISFFGGIFTVLQFADLQTIVEKGALSQIIAGNNIFNALFMVAVSVLIMFLHQLDFGLPNIFGIIGILNIGAGVVLVFLHRHEFEHYWRF